MPLQKIPNQNLSETGPIQLPDNISPAVYVQQFVDWLEAKDPENDIRLVHLRLVWFYSFSLEENGVVGYGEVGLKEGVFNVSMSLVKTADRKKSLRGSATVYMSDRRWDHTIINSGLPFDPDKSRQVDVTIWADTGEIVLKFDPSPTWKISPTYVASSNLVYGFPANFGETPVPMILLSLHMKEAAQV